MSKSGLSISDYFVKLSSEKTVNIIDIKAVLVELKKIGTNINQIARRVNSGFFRPRNFDKVVEQQNKIIEMLSVIMEEL